MPGSPSRCGRPWLLLWLEPLETPFPQRFPRCCTILLVFFPYCTLHYQFIKKKKNLCPGVFIIVNGSTTESSLPELHNNDNNNDNDNNNKKKITFLCNPSEKQKK